jgi:hypothetical protein
LDRRHVRIDAEDGPCSPLSLLPYDARIMPHRLKFASVVVIVNDALRLRLAR